MKNTRTKLSYIFEQVLPWAVLAIILLYTYVKFFQYPYVGFRWDSSGQVAFIFTNGNSVTPLHIGDRLLQADSVSWADYKQDLRKPFVDYPKRGQVVQLRLERSGQEMTIPWVAPGPNIGEINDMIWTEGWLGLVFWFMGTLTFLNLRPKNERWKLLVAFNFLTAIWLTTGSGPSILHIWGSTIVLRIFVWLSIPVYLHLHWVFPKPLGRLSPLIVWSAYILATLLAIAELFQLIRQNFYYLGFLLSIIGSLVMLVVHAICQPEVRKEFRAFLFIALLSFVPSIVIGLLGMLTRLPVIFGGFGLLSLPLLPMAYFFIALRRQMGGLEIRFNQALSVYIYTVLFMVALLPLFGLLNQLMTGPGAVVVTGVVVLITTILVTIFGYSRFQAFVERAILGVSLPPKNLLELFSERIITSNSFADLQKILEAEILPRLYINQFVFLQINEGSPQVLHSVGMDTKDQTIPSALTLSGQMAGKYRPVETIEASDPFAWVRLSIELKITGELIGLWLFGRHDPDDFYSQMEIILIQSLANQTAIAMSNILQTQRVLEMYQQDISRHENDRMRLALDLHDSILNQMATMLLSLDDSSISPRFQDAYDDLTGRLREIVSNLRPPMLNDGLKPALDELVESLLENNQNRLNLTLDLKPAESRYPEEVEQHLFRIVQEACENALRHGQATIIRITGHLLTDEVDLIVADEGIGFEIGKGFELAGLLADKHFGLAGMLERAKLIGGDVKIDSHPTTGTRVSIRWSSSRN